MFEVWHGGMSFHGGLLSVIIAMVVYCRWLRIPFFAFTDIIACVTPVGLFFGRIAIFINGELWGRVAYDVPLSLVFPGGAPARPQNRRVGKQGVRPLRTGWSPE